MSFDKHIVVWIQRFKDRDTYMLQWHDPVTGKRRSKSAGTSIKGVAEMRRTELEYEINHNMHQEASRMSWEKFRERFEDEYLSGRRPSTRESFSVTFNSFERLCRPQTLRAITERTVSAFVAALRKEPGQKGEPVKESTIKVRLQFLHTALSWAAKQKLIPECPAFPTIRPPKRKPQPVSTEAFERLLAKAPDKNMRVFLLTGWLAGLRLNEAVCLEWEEADKAPYLDLDRERIVLPAGFVKAVEDQWVPLDTSLRDAILALPRQGKRVFRFVDHKGRPVKEKAVGNRVALLGRLAGVKLTMKSLRRGFGCYWAARVPAQILQKLMRHHNIALTMNFYANIDDAATQAILGRESAEIENLRNGLRNNAQDEPAEEENKNPSSLDS
jgi:integrase